MATLHDMDVDDFLRRAVTIEPLGINEEYIQLPADLAYYGARFAEASRRFMAAKAELDRTEARAFLLAREGGTAKTVDAAKAMAEIDPLTIDARDRLINAEVEKIRLYGVLDALRTKREMLISLGAQIRKEMDSDPIIREQRRMTREFG